jgi:hypothetical protein
VANPKNEDGRRMAIRVRRSDWKVRRPDVKKGAEGIIKREVGDEQKLHLKVEKSHILFAAYFIGALSR